MPNEDADALDSSDTTDDHRCDYCERKFDTKRGKTIHQTKSHDVPYKNRDWLKERYWGRNLTIHEIASIADCDDETIRYWLKKNDIELRDVGGIEKSGLYRNKEWLVEQYHANGLTVEEVADLTTINESGIRSWMNKFGIGRRLSSGKYEYDVPRDEEWLREKYEDLGSVQAVADDLDVAREAVRKVMVQLGIERKGDSGHIDGEVTFYTGNDGREYIYFHQSGSRRGLCLSVQRIVAIGEYGLDAVAGKVVHHGAGDDPSPIKWDNRPSNLKPMSRADHSREHGVLLDYMERNDE